MSKTDVGEVVERLLDQVPATVQHHMESPWAEIIEAVYLLQSLSERVEELSEKYAEAVNKYADTVDKYEGAVNKKHEARNQALEEAAQIAQRSLDSEEKFYRNNGDNFGHQMEASGGMDIAEEIRDAIRSLKTQGERQ